MRLFRRIDLHVVRFNRQTSSPLGGFPPKRGQAATLPSSTIRLLAWSKLALGRLGPPLQATLLVKQHIALQSNRVLTALLKTTLERPAGTETGNLVEGVSLSRPFRAQVRY